MQIIHFLIFGFLLTSCSSGTESIQKASDGAVDDVGCKNIKSKMFDVVLAGVDTRAEVVAPNDLKSIIQKRFNQKWSAKLSDDQKKQLEEKMLGFYKELYETLKNEKSLPVIQQQLAKLEIGIVEEAKFPEKNEILQARADELFTLAESFNLKCDEETPPTPIDSNSISYGSFYTLATAYQSCDVLDKLPMSLSTPSVKGIVSTGTHSSGIGKTREIRDLASVQNTHYYLQQIQYERGCFAVNKNPLIYDFGGKPYTSTLTPNVLDFFKDAGSGTKVLGADCSGFVFAAIGAAGLKVSSTVDMKTSLVNGIGASEYMNPKANRMNCFKYPTFGFKEGSIEEGDIVSIKGHVFIIDQIGDDPFGYLKLTNVNQCKNLTYKDFDFVIAQSSPTKNGIGISRSFAKDYVIESSTIKNGLEYFAKQACELHFNKTDKVVDYSALRIVRHKGTDECRMKPFSLKHEECIQSCFSKN